MTRWLRFNAVGIMGMAVQLILIAVLVRVFKMHYLPATALAVEVAILHNFLWHVRWTWPDRPLVGLFTLLRFNVAVGVVSITGNVWLAYLLVSIGSLDPVLANLVSIITLSLINFLVCDNLVFSYGNGNAEHSE